MKHIKLFENFLNEEQQYTAENNKEYAKYLMDSLKGEWNDSGYFKELKRYYETGEYGSDSKKPVGRPRNDMRPKEVQIAGYKFWLENQYENVKRMIYGYGSKEKNELKTYEEYFKK